MKRTQIINRAMYNKNESINRAAKELIQIENRLLSLSLKNFNKKKDFISSSSSSSSASSSFCPSSLSSFPFNFNGSDEKNNNKYDKCGNLSSHQDLYCRSYFILFFILSYFIS